MGYVFETRGYIVLFWLSKIDHCWIDEKWYMGRRTIDVSPSWIFWNYRKFVSEDLNLVFVEILYSPMLGTIMMFCASIFVNVYCIRDEANSLSCKVNLSTFFRDLTDLQDFITWIVSCPWTTWEKSLGWILQLLDHSKLLGEDLFPITVNLVCHSFLSICLQ